MAIGQVPLIPLYRVQPDPDARLQHFGPNNSQLFGKPLLDLPTPVSRTPQARRVAPSPVETEAAETWKARQPNDRSVATTGWGTSQPGRLSQVASTPPSKIGALVDLIG